MAPQFVLSSELKKMYTHHPLGQLFTPQLKAQNEFLRTYARKGGARTRTQVFSPLPTVPSSMSH